MLVDGEIDAVLRGEVRTGPGLKPLFPDAGREEKSWFAKHGVTPINHMVVVSETVVAGPSGSRARSLQAVARERDAGVNGLATVQC